jgi:putative Mn2+ efflux pump MntP
MELSSILLVGIGVSMDAFTVALVKGLCSKDSRTRISLIIGLSFGFFQGFMIWLGYSVGRGFNQYIVDYDHWISFILLSVIGVKMMLDGLKSDSINCEIEPRLSLRTLLYISFATSVDALAVGVSFSFQDQSIVRTSLIIGFITFILSSIGVLIGKRSALWLDHKAEIFGGLVLVFMGLRILLTHLFA